MTFLTNVGNSTTANASWTTPGGTSALYQPNEELVDIFTCQKVYVKEDGSLFVQAKSGMPQVCSASFL